MYKGQSKICILLNTRDHLVGTVNNGRPLIIFLYLGDAWLGGYDMNKNDVFVWLDGSPVSDTFSNWYPGKPSSSSEDFMMISSGLWENWDLLFPPGDGLPALCEGKVSRCPRSSDNVSLPKRAESLWENRIGI